MELGLALPQYDFSVPGTPRLDWPTLAAYATTAERNGFDSLWLSDHIVWAIDRYGAAPGNHEGYDPLPTLAALARITSTVRLGTLVLAAPLRPTTVLAKALTSIDHISNGRLTVGIGAGWFEPDFELTGQPMPPPKERLANLRNAIDTLKAAFAEDQPPPNHPPPIQQPRPPIWVGGKGPKLRQLATEHADGWNYCWQATPAEYAELLPETQAPPHFHRSLGIYTLVGENQRDLEQRFERLRQTSPRGTVKAATVDEYRQGRLVGTVDQVEDQLHAWKEAGIQTLIACLGAVPFSVTAEDDIESVAAAASRVR